MLEVINENNEVIGLELRELIHEKGLLHREIHIWFMTPDREIIFQHRAKDKDTYPDKLDATVGGHVEPGMSYEETAVKECKEETGLDIDLLKLKFVKKLFSDVTDPITKRRNYSLLSEYVYLYEGKIEDLVIEEGKAIGFEPWKIDSLPRLSPEDQEKFIPRIYSQDFLDIFEEGQKLLELK